MTARDWWKRGRRVMWAVEGAPDYGLKGTITRVDATKARIHVRWDDGEGGWFEASSTIVPTAGARPAYGGGR